MANEFIPFIPGQITLGLNIISQSCPGAVKSDFYGVKAEIEDIGNFTVFHALEFAEEHYCTLAIRHSLNNAVYAGIHFTPHESMFGVMQFFIT